jgi:hypothetical protein
MAQVLMDDDPPAPERLLKVECGSQSFLQMAYPGRG